MAKPARLTASVKSAQSTNGLASCVLVVSLVLAAALLAVLLVELGAAVFSELEADFACELPQEARSMIKDVPSAMGSNFFIIHPFLFIVFVEFANGDSI